MPDNKNKIDALVIRRAVIAVTSGIMTVLLVLSCVFGYEFSYYKSKYNLLKATAAENSASSGSSSPETSSGAAPAAGKYAKLYPEMRADPTFAGVKPLAKNTVYLTFDDGPSQYTPELLDTLKKYSAKATFFVVGNQVGEKGTKTLKRIAKEGHAIGVHSYSHEYEEIYASVEAFLKDFHKTYKLIKNTTGKAPSIFRFPGGSVNVFNRTVYRDIIAEMTRRGFVYYDWDITSGDATYSPSSDTITRNVLSQMKGHKNGVVLFHDTKYASVASMDYIVSSLKKKYEFKALSDKLSPVYFGYSA